MMIHPDGEHHILIWQGKSIPGNNFDYPYIHGKAIMAAGHSFYSVSDEYFTSTADRCLRI